MSNPHIPTILINLLGGLAIFILGMSLMTEALNSLAGSKMKTFLSAFTKNRFTAALTGAAVTAVVQSSSVTTVLLVGFSSVGLISVTQSVGVIFGANVGSTITAQIIAFNVSQAAAPLLAIGIFAHLFKKHKRVSQVGLFLLGLGAIFFGMKEMGSSTYPLRTYEPFLSMMRAIAHPALGILAGFLFTAIVQSSAAAIGLVIVFASQGLITLEGAIAIALGSNIGTCVTAALAAIGRPSAAWRVAFIHVLFNVAGVALWLAFIPQLAEAATFLAQATTGDASIAREIAMAHTLFNVANLLAFIGFAGVVSTLATRLVPDKRKDDADTSKPIYLEPYYLKTPALAIDRARLETTRLGGYALRMAEEIPLVAISGDEASIRQLSNRDDELDALQTAVLAYLAKIDTAQLSPTEMEEIHEVISLANAWENIGDTLENHVLSLAQVRLDTGLEISAATRESIEQLHQELLKHMRVALLVATERNLELAHKLIDSKADFEAKADKAELQLAGRLAGMEEKRLHLYRIESDIIGNFKRIHHYLRRIAKLTLNVD